MALFSVPTASCGRLPHSLACVPLSLQWVGKSGRAVPCNALPVSVSTGGQVRVARADKMYSLPSTATGRTKTTAMTTRNTNEREE